MNKYSEIKTIQWTAILLADRFFGLLSSGWRRKTFLSFAMIGLLSINEQSMAQVVWQGEFRSAGNDSSLNTFNAIYPAGAIFDEGRLQLSPNGGLHELDGKFDRGAGSGSVWADLDPTHLRFSATLDTMQYGTLSEQILWHTTFTIHNVTNKVIMGSLVASLFVDGGIAVTSNGQASMRIGFTLEPGNSVVGFKRIIPNLFDNSFPADNEFEVGAAFDLPPGYATTYTLAFAEYGTLFLPSAGSGSLNYSQSVIWDGLKLVGSAGESIEGLEITSSAGFDLTKSYRDNVAVTPVPEAGTLAWLFFALLAVLIRWRKAVARNSQIDQVVILQRQ